MKDTPLSISVVSGDELQKLEANNLPNVLRRLGNVSQAPGNPRTFSLTIRGVGLSVSAGDAIDASVGVTVDDVSYASPAFATGINQLDLESVSVTRGPQGTLGGKNTNIGQVVINTQAPTFKPEAWASITTGDWNTLLTKAVVGGPVIDNLVAWRGTFYRDQADGPYRNVYNKNYTYKNNDLTYGRLQFLVTPDPNLRARISLEYAPVGRELSDTYLTYNRPTPLKYDTGATVDQNNQPVGKLSRRWFTREANYSVDDYLADEINRNLQLRSNFGTKGASANIDWVVGDYTLKSISAYKSYYWECENGQLTVFNINRRGSSCAIVDFNQVSQELRINSPVGGLIDYQAGLYYIKTHSDYGSEAGEKGADAGAYFANTAQYNRLDADTNGQVLMQNSVERLITRRTEKFDSESPAAYGSINWHLSEPLTVITGLRVTSERRTNTGSRSDIINQGYGFDLNPASRNNLALGGFTLNTQNELATGYTPQQLALANSVAKKYFNVTNYADLNVDQKRQVADAKAIRLAQLGTLYDTTDARSYNGVLPTFNLTPSYRFNDQYTAYAAWQHGEKSGGAQIVGADANGGKSIPIKSETSNVYELGFKAASRDRTIFFNADVFFNRIKDFQQLLYFYDEAQTLANNNGNLAYSPGLGNVPEVQIKGVELDVTYSGLPDTTLRLAGAYNDARYEDFKFLAKPAELNDGAAGSAAYYDVSGRRLPNAPHLTFNFSGDYRRPVLGKAEVHGNFNYSYTGSYNADPSLSRYTTVDAYGLLDVSFGIGRRDGRFDLNLVFRNLLDTDYGYLSNWNTYVPSYPRWAGVTLSGRFN